MFTLTSSSRPTPRSLHIDSDTQTVLINSSSEFLSLSQILKPLVPSEGAPPRARIIAAHRVVPLTRYASVDALESLLQCLETGRGSGKGQRRGWSHLRGAPTVPQRHGNGRGSRSRVGVP